MTGRQHYMDVLQPAPQRPRKRVNLVTVIALCLALPLWAAIIWHALSRSTTTPVEPGTVQATQLQPFDAQASDARIEGFRAGFMAGVEQGCARSASLTHPLQVR
jgi:hypothetical protein